MRTIFKSLFIACVWAALAVAAPDASACTYTCAQVAPRCRQCVDTGEWTGATCTSYTSCGCVYTVNLCYGPLSVAALTTLDRTADEPTSCAAAPIVDGESNQVAEPAAQ